MRPQQIAEGRQHMQPIAVFRQPSVADFVVAELALDRAEWMLHFGSNAGLESLDPMHGAGLGELGSASRTHRNIPIHRATPVFLALVYARVAGIGPDMAFFTVLRPAVLPTDDTAEAEVLVSRQSLEEIVGEQPASEEGFEWRGTSRSETQVVSATYVEGASATGL